MDREMDRESERERGYRMALKGDSSSQPLVFICNPALPKVAETVTKLVKPLLTTQ